MRCIPCWKGRQEGGPREEERQPAGCCPPPERPGLPKKPKPAAAEGVPPAAGSPSGSEGAGGSSWRAWEGPAERAQLRAIESNPSGVNEQSEYESKGAASGVSPPTFAARTDFQQQHLRARTTFTSEQLQKLESVFQKQRYLTASDRIQLATSLDLPVEQVTYWFQNRRTKLRRELRNRRQSSLSSPPSSSHNPRVPSNFSQDFPMYPQQNAPPFMPNTALQSIPPCPLYQPAPPPYPFLTLRLPFYFPLLPLRPPDTQHEEDCRLPSPK